MQMKENPYICTLIKKQIIKTNNMNKFWKIITVGVLASAVLLTSCKKDEEETPEPTTPDACASATFPETTGSSTVKLKNFANTANTSGSDGKETITVTAGQTLVLAIGVTEGDKNVQKIRVYESDCENTLGTQSGDKIDLRVKNDEQIRNFSYDVPSGSATLYLNVEIDEKGGNVTYYRITLDVSGSGEMGSYTGVVLGSNGSAEPSRMSSSTGLTYSSCNAAENIDDIDVTFATQTTGSFNSFLSSNPGRFDASGELALTTSEATGCDSIGSSLETQSTAGGTATYFATSTIDFDNATAADLGAITASTSQTVQVTAVDDVFEFVNAAGNKGVIKVTAVNAFGLNDTRTDITVSVKVLK